MTFEDSVEFLAWLQGQFFRRWAVPADAELEAWVEILTPFTPEQARSAAKVHWEEQQRYGKPDPGKMRQRLREAAKRAQDRPAGEAKPDGFVDALRRRWPGKTQGMPDHEVLMRYYRHIWIVLAKERETYREPIRQQAANALAAVGLYDRADTGGYDFGRAERAASACVEGPWQFDEALDDLREFRAQRGAEAMP